MEQLSISNEAIIAAVRSHLPQRSVIQVEDRGAWIRRIYKITLDGNEVVYLKIDQDFAASEKETTICRLLRSNGLPAPTVLALDTSRALLPESFLIQAHAGGERLGTLLDRVSQQQQTQIYRALGQFYRRLHSVHHAHSGWIDETGKVLPFSPTAYQYQEVILHIGSEAVAQNRLAEDTHLRLSRFWGEHLTMLDQHSPSLVSGALHWTVFLEDCQGWRVTKLTDLHDFLFWDPAWDAASIRYPVFRPPLTDDLWDAFVEAYGGVPDEKRLRLYALMQHLDAAMGNYMEPFSTQHEHWKAFIWNNYDQVLREAENL